MTADLDAARDQLAAALTHQQWCPAYCAGDGECECLTARRNTADELLLVVDRIATERAAAELRAAAKGLGNPRRHRPYAEYLRACADALDPS